MQQIVLTRASWSPRWAQKIAGFDINGVFTLTERVFVTEKENVYRSAEGQEYVIQSWVPDGRGYSDRKGGE